MKCIMMTSLWLAAALLAADPLELKLWPNGAPGSEGKTAAETTRLAGDLKERVVSNVHQPSLAVYLPAKTTTPTAAVIIAPGGGHRELWSDHEGHNVARWLADHGVAGIVLKYRLAREKDSTYKIEGESLADTQRALRVTRANAAAWNVAPGKVGVMGFSAGGELAALAAVRPAADEERPAFQALIYPAIPKDMALSRDTPAAFLVCGENDRQNISQGLPELYLAMRRAGASAELHVYSNVGHGFGLRSTMKGPVAGWIVRFHEWLSARP